MKENKTIKWAKENKKCVIAGIAGVSLAAVCGYVGYKFGVSSAIKEMRKMIYDNSDDISNEVLNGTRIIGKLTARNGELIADTNIWAKHNRACGAALELKLADIHDVVTAVTDTMKENFPDYDYDNGNLMIEFMKKSE